MILPGEKFRTEDEFLLKLIEKKVWNVLYHEQELGEAHRHLAIVKATFARGYADDLHGVTEQEGEPEDAETPVAYVRALLGCALSGVSHHEDALRSGHDELAMVTAVLARLQVSFDMVKITAEQIARLNK